MDGRSVTRKAHQKWWVAFTPFDLCATEPAEQEGVMTMRKELPIPDRMRVSRA